MPLMHTLYIYTITIYTLAFKAYYENNLVFATVLSYKRLFTWESWRDLYVMKMFVDFHGTLLAEVASQMRWYESPKCHIKRD